MEHGKYWLNDRSSRVSIIPRQQILILDCVETNRGRENQNFTSDSVFSVNSFSPSEVPIHMWDVTFIQS